MNIEISKIKIGNRRALGDVTELAESIKEIGLLNPITVTKDYTLIAGHHRLKAFEALGIDLIPIRIVDCTALQAELAEIDENLIRNNGTELEQGISLARRKEIYLELHPETAKNVAGGKAGGNGREKVANDTMSFATDTSKKTGKSKRTTERKVSIGEKLGGMQDAIKAAGIDDSQKDLTELAKLKDKSPDQIKAVLAIVANDSVSVKSAIRQLSLSNQKAIIESGNIEKPTGLYDVISIDPPWKYEQGESNSYSEDGRRVANPYPEMSLDQIKALNLPVKDDSVMWLWTTQKFLNDSFSLLEEWGFEHKATMVWDKEQMGMGHWLRMQCEFCLLAVKGNPVWSNTHVRDILREKRREHSRKPEEFYNIVNEICVGDKLDYFSREKREGWVNFGNDKELFNA